MLVPAPTKLQSTEGNYTNFGPKTLRHWLLVLVV